MSAKNTLKNNQAKAAIVKGLMIQLINTVRNNPFGFLPTSLIAEKSIYTIIG
ncbi:Ribokinase [Moritella viscosa]|nr:Ribokinase [Moritella viscosa]